MQPIPEGDKGDRRVTGKQNPSRLWILSRIEQEVGYLASVKGRLFSKFSREFNDKSASDFA